MTSVSLALARSPHLHASAPRATITRPHRSLLSPYATRISLAAPVRHHPSAVRTACPGHVPHTGAVAPPRKSARPHRRHRPSPHRRRRPAVASSPLLAPVPSPLRPPPRRSPVSGLRTYAGAPASLLPRPLRPQPRHGYVPAAAPASSSLRSGSLQARFQPGVVDLPQLSSRPAVCLVLPTAVQDFSIDMNQEPAMELWME